MGVQTFSNNQPNRFEPPAQCPRVHFQSQWEAFVHTACAFFLFKHTNNVRECDHARTITYVPLAATICTTFSSLPSESKLIRDFWKSGVSSSRWAFTNPVVPSWFKRRWEGGQGEVGWRAEWQWQQGFVGETRVSWEDDWIIRAMNRKRRAAPVVSG